MISQCLPMLMDMSKEECRGELRSLELMAYKQMVSVLRAQGDLSKEKRKILSEVQSLLNIGTEWHKAEVRRAVNDEVLFTISYRLCGSRNGQLEWATEARRLVPLIPRAVPQVAYTAYATRMAQKYYEKNKEKSLPSETADHSPCDEDLGRQSEDTDSEEETDGLRYLPDDMIPASLCVRTSTHSRLHPQEDSTTASTTASTNLPPSPDHFTSSTTSPAIKDKTDGVTYTTNRPPDVMSPPPPNTSNTPNNNTTVTENSGNVTAPPTQTSQRKRKRSSSMEKLVPQPVPMLVPQSPPRDAGDAFSTFKQSRSFGSSSSNPAVKMNSSSSMRQSSGSSASNSLPAQKVILVSTSGANAPPPTAIVSHSGIGGNAPGGAIGSNAPGGGLGGNASGGGCGGNASGGGIGGNSGIYQRPINVLKSSGSSSGIMGRPVMVQQQQHHYGASASTPSNTPNTPVQMISRVRPRLGGSSGGPAMPPTGGVNTAGGVTHHTPGGVSHHTQTAQRFSSRLPVGPAAGATHQQQPHIYLHTDALSADQGYESMTYSQQQTTAGPFSSASSGGPQQQMRTSCHPSSGTISRVVSVVGPSSNVGPNGNVPAANTTKIISRPPSSLQPQAAGIVASRQHQQAATAGLIGQQMSAGAGSNNNAGVVYQPQHHLTTAASAIIAPSPSGSITVVTRTLATPYHPGHTTPGVSQRVVTLSTGRNPNNNTGHTPNLPQQTQFLSASVLNNPQNMPPQQQQRPNISDVGGNNITTKTMIISSGGNNNNVGSNSRLNQSQTTGNSRGLTQAPTTISANSRGGLNQSATPTTISGNRPASNTPRGSAPPPPNASTGAPNSTFISGRGRAPSTSSPSVMAGRGRSLTGGGVTNASSLLPTGRGGTIRPTLQTVRVPPLGSSVGGASGGGRSNVIVVHKGPPTISSSRGGGGGSSHATGVAGPYQHHRDISTKISIGKSVGGTPATARGAVAGGNSSAAATLLQRAAPTMLRTTSLPPQRATAVLQQGAAAPINAAVSIVVENTAVHSSQTPQQQLMASNKLAPKATYQYQQGGSSQQQITVSSKQQQQLLLAATSSSNFFSKKSQLQTDAIDRSSPSYHLHDNASNAAVGGARKGSKSRSNSPTTISTKVSAPASSLGPFSSLSMETSSVPTAMESVAMESSMIGSVSMDLSDNWLSIGAAAAAVAASAITISDQGVGVSQLVNNTPVAVGPAPLVHHTSIALPSSSLAPPSSSVAPPIFSSSTPLSSISLAPSSSSLCPSSSSISLETSSVPTAMDTVTTESSMIDGVNLDLSDNWLSIGAAAAAVAASAITISDQGNSYDGDMTGAGKLSDAGSLSHSPMEAAGLPAGHVLAFEEAMEVLGRGDKESARSLLLQAGIEFLDTDSDLPSGSSTAGTDQQ